MILSTNYLRWLPNLLEIAFNGRRVQTQILQIRSSQSFNSLIFQTMWLLETKTHRDVYPSITNSSKENDEGLATSVFFFDNLFRLPFSWRKLQKWGFFLIK